MAPSDRCATTSWPTSLCILLLRLAAGGWCGVAGCGVRGWAPGSGIRTRGSGCWLRFRFPSSWILRGLQAMSWNGAAGSGKDKAAFAGTQAELAKMFNANFEKKYACARSACVCVRACSRGLVRVFHTRKKKDEGCWWR